MKWIHRIQILLGLWILLSPWILEYASITPALWSNVISGALVSLLGFWGIFYEEPEEEN